MRTLIKKIIHHTYRPLLLHYLKKDRVYRYGNLSVLVKQGVFHPGFFFSTRFLLEELATEDLQNKTLLELGAGSGLISVYAATRGALVSATDINPEAVENIRLNFNRQEKELPNARILQSDLFDNIPEQHFDYMIINPPYYPLNPANEAEKAWYCGDSFQYFEKLFTQLGAYMQPKTQAWLSLSEDCNRNLISSIARKNKLSMQIRRQKKTAWEWHYIFSITKQEQILQ